MSPRTIGVVGAGQMGNGIAHVAAATGFDVILADVEDRFLESARGTIEIDGRPAAIRSPRAR